LAGAGLVWIMLNMVVQAPQIALARAAEGELPPETTAIVNDIGLALATIADVPVAVLLVAVGVLSLRAAFRVGWDGSR
jgi:hypothetical protein